MLILTGIVLKRAGFLTKESSRVMTRLALDISLPCSIVRSFLIEMDEEKLRVFGTVLLIGTAVMLVQVGASFIAFNMIPREHRDPMRYGLINANNAFLGYPMVEGIFGTEGIAIASIYMIPVRISIWSVGLGIFTAQGAKGKAIVKNCLLHPAMIAMYIGLFFMVTQLTPPAFLNDGMRMLANCLTPLSMLTIGTILAEVPVRKLLDPQILWFCLVRLVLIPALILLVCRLLSAPALTTGVCVLMSAMPAASLTAMLSLQYGRDSAFATLIVTLSTLLSVLTVPVWMMIVSSLVG